jgi:hypothetical protein
VARRSKRSLVDDDPVRRRVTLKPRRRVQDIPRRHPLTSEWLRSKAHERLPGRDSDPNLERLLFLRPLANGQRSTNRSLRIVLMSGRSAEQADDSITDELLDRSTVPFNLSTHPPPIRLLYRPNILRIQSFRRGRKVDQVSEQDTDHFPLFTRRLRRSEG